MKKEIPEIQERDLNIAKELDIKNLVVTGTTRRNIEIHKKRSKNKYNFNDILNSEGKDLYIF